MGGSKNGHDLFIVDNSDEGWTEREYATRNFARRMGYRRTGSAINESTRSLVNGLIREGRLEKEDSQIRRIRNP